MNRACDAAPAVSLIASLGLVVVSQSAMAAPGDTVRISIAPDIQQREGGSVYPAISADGQYVAFLSADKDFVEGFNARSTVLLHDRESGATWPLGSSVTAPAISADGRFVVWLTRSVNVYDRQSGETDSLVDPYYSLQGRATISGDGRYVAFASWDPTLVANDTNSHPDAFVFDRLTREVQRIDVSSDGAESDRGAALPTISADGRYVSFLSDATNLVAGKTIDSRQHVYLHDRQTHTTQLVSASPNGQPGNSASYASSISRDGRYIAFLSTASNLVDVTTSAWENVFVYDRQTGELQRIGASSQFTGSNTFPPPFRQMDGTLRSTPSLRIWSEGIRTIATTSSSSTEIQEARSG